MEVQVGSSFVASLVGNCLQKTVCFEKQKPNPTKAIGHCHSTLHLITIVILGQPFMKQFKMVQDWGYSYLYLRHETAITRVNLKNHSHRDVTHMPMDEFDLASSEESNSQEGDERANLWMCGAS